MRAGSLRHRLIIQSKNSTRDSMGGTSYSWEDEKTVYGAIWPLKGTEKINGINTIIVEVIEKTKNPDPIRIYVGPKNFLIHKFTYINEGKEAVINLRYVNIEKYIVLENISCNSAALSDLGLSLEEKEYSILSFSAYKMNIGLTKADFIRPEGE